MSRTEGGPPRITGGTLRGRIVTVPQTGGVRPMLARTRQALFNMLGNEFTGSVWDCFAGSGLLGLEALSRGASHAVFIEAEPRHAAQVAANMRALGVAARASLFRRSAFTVVRPGADLPHTPAELVILDPPHAMAVDAESEFWPWLASLPDTALVDDSTTVVMGHPARMEWPDTGRMARDRTREYGSVAITLLRRA